MLHIKNILYLTDFSDNSKAAYPHAAFLAKHDEAVLHVLHVNVLPSDVSPVDKDLAALRTTLTDQLSGVGEKSSFEEVMASLPASAVRAEVEAPTVAEGIFEYIDQHDIDLVVMGTHGRGGLGHFLLGSVAERVVRRAPCPVLTLRHHPNRSFLPKEIQTILVPIDFSEHSRAALRHAVELAALYEARLELLHVVEETLHPAFYNTGVVSVYDMDPDIEQKAKDRMRTLYADAFGPVRGVRFSTRYGHAAHEIVQHTRDFSIDMVVIATHGMTDLERFFLGSVPEKVVRHTPCPVFTVKAHGKSLLQGNGYGPTA